MRVLRPSHGVNIISQHPPKLFTRVLLFRILSSQLRPTNTLVPNTFSPLNQGD